MALTATQLDAGISHWRTTRWPQDFHNEFYHRMQSGNPKGIFNEHWWQTFVLELSKWKALRPRSQEFVSRRAADRFEKLTQVWAEVMTEAVLRSDISEVEWSQVCSFPDLVEEIKGVDSPVFTSKFCHFLAPQIFPVIDNAAMGNPFYTYEHYYTTGKSEWAETPAATQLQLVSELTRQMAETPIKAYPFKCKIIEICLIGRHRLNSR